MYAGRGGMSITLVTQFDVKLVHAIEAFTSKYNSQISPCYRSFHK